MTTLDAVKLLTNGRDKREPHYREKELAELKLQAVYTRIFKRQYKQMEERLRLLNIARKGNPAYDDIFEIDEETEGEIIRLLLTAANGGAEMFEESIDFTFDNTKTNIEAARWARNTGISLNVFMGKNTKQAVREAVALFIETPGMTIQDVMDMLPLKPSRALNVAVTEITRAYAEGQKIAGRELQRQYPDVKVTKTWFTNNDDRVCDICVPLDMQEVDMDDTFKSIDGVELESPPGHERCRCWISTGTKL